MPELSLVAEEDGQMVGHILLTKIKVIDQEKQYESLALAPVSVLPAQRKQGIGGTLINKAHEIARRVGFSSVKLLGHADYYPHFGYQKVSTFGISLPFDVPEENCKAIELEENALAGVSGTVDYPMEFYE